VQGTVVIRRRFGTSGEERTELWVKLHNEKRRNLYCSLNIIITVKAKRVIWAGHEAGMSEMRDTKKTYKILVQNQDKINYLG
jgi:hypothetical protein